jgi:hypothetical protein
MCAGTNANRRAISLRWRIFALRKIDESEPWSRTVIETSVHEAAAVGRAVGIVSNPQLNPQNAMSCTTYAVFGSPRMSVKSL